jgi:hypothetical protein
MIPLLYRKPNSLASLRGKPPFVTYTIFAKFFSNVHKSYLKPSIFCHLRIPTKSLQFILILQIFSKSSFLAYLLFHIEFMSNLLTIIKSSSFNFKSNPTSKFTNPSYMLKLYSFIFRDISYRKYVYYNPFIVRINQSSLR